MNVVHIHVHFCVYYMIEMEKTKTKKRNRQGPSLHKLRAFVVIVQLFLIFQERGYCSNTEGCPVNPELLTYCGSIGTPLEA